MRAIMARLENYFVAPTQRMLAKLNEWPILPYLKPGVLNRRFIVTDNGLIGLAPPRAMVDDEIIVLQGGSLPFVLRAYSAENRNFNSQRTSYTVVGEAYVEGIMQGEALGKSPELRTSTQKHEQETPELRGPRKDQPNKTQQELPGRSKNKAAKLIRRLDSLRSSNITRKQETPLDSSDRADPQNIEDPETEDALIERLWQDVYLY